MKKKLLITVGAGASVEFGLPSVSSVDDLFDRHASANFPLADDADSNLYRYICQAINDYYEAAPKNRRKQANFEEVLYQINLLAQCYGDEGRQNGTNALLQPKGLPDIRGADGRRQSVDHRCEICPRHCRML